jgi:hypothetical protein
VAPCTLCLTDSCLPNFANAELLLTRGKARCDLFPQCVGTLSPPKGKSMKSSLKQSSSKQPLPKQSTSRSGTPQQRSLQLTKRAPIPPKMPAAVKMMPASVVRTQVHPPKVAPQAHLRASITQPAQQPRGRHEAPRKPHLVTAQDASRIQSIVALLQGGTIDKNSYVGVIQRAAVHNEGKSGQRLKK